MFLYGCFIRNRKALLTTAEMESFDQKTEAFTKWVGSTFKVVSPKFKIQDLRNIGQGRGLIAIDNISEGEVLFELSRDSILNINTAQITKLRAENKSVLLSLNQWQCLIICVAYEWFIGSKSKLFDYFNVLPLATNDYNSLMFWNDDELSYLKPSGVMQRIGKQQAEDMYALLVADIIPNKLKLPDLAEFLSLEKFHIVASLIMSYSFDVDNPDQVEADEEDEDHGEHDGHAHDHDNAEDGDAHDNDDEIEEEEEEMLSEDPISQDDYFKSLVPLADTLNSNTSLFNAVLKYENTKLVMTAEKNIAKGEQIFNIYGEMPNSEILRKYGYVELPNSKFEFAEIPLELIKDHFQTLYESKLKFLKSPQIEKLLELIFENIQESEYLEDTLSEELESGIVIDKYEIYKNGEILPELILLVSIVLSLCQVAESDEKWFKKIAKSVERKPSSDLLLLINRAILKNHQLLEEKSILTKSTLSNLQEIIKLRISHYPTEIIDGTFKLPLEYGSFNRKELANIVLFSEVRCLKDVVDGKFPPLDENKLPRFSIIDDAKFLKNLLKRKFEEQGSKPKRQKK